VFILFQLFPAFAKESHFNELFKLVNEFKLEQTQDTEIGYLCSFKVDSNGNIWIADLGSEQDPSTVKIYSPEGKLLRVIQGTDKFKSARDIEFDLRKQVYVADLFNKIAVFDSLGNFKYSISTEDEKSSWAITPFSIKYDFKYDYLFVGAYEGFGGKDSVGQYLHKYTTSGKLIGSFLPIDKNLIRLAPADPAIVYLDLDQNGNIWCVQSMAYEIFKFSPGGKLIQKFQGKSRFYIPPYKLTSPSGVKAINTWMKTWTQIANCLVAENGLILISLQTHKPTEYVLEIYNPDGKLLAGDIQTNYRLLGKDNEGFLYFLLDGEKKGESQEFKIGKFSLNLKP
jgi:WD40 repeat protein